MMKTNNATFKNTFLDKNGHYHKWATTHRFDNSNALNLASNFFSSIYKNFLKRTIFNAIKNKEIKYINNSVIGFVNSKICEFAVKQLNGTIRYIHIYKKDFIKSKVFPDADKLKIMLGESYERT